MNASSSIRQRQVGEGPPGEHVAVPFDHLAVSVVFLSVLVLAVSVFSVLVPMLFLVVFLRVMLFVMVVRMSDLLAVPDSHCQLQVDVRRIRNEVADLRSVIQPRVMAEQVGRGERGVGKGPVVWVNRVQPSESEQLAANLPLEPTGYVQKRHIGLFDIDLGVDRVVFQVFLFDGNDQVSPYRRVEVALEAWFRLSHTEFLVVGVIVGIGCHRLNVDDGTDFRNFEF
jgi:hypothetical protein